MSDCDEKKVKIKNYHNQKAFVILNDKMDFVFFETAGGGGGSDGRGRLEMKKIQLLLKKKQ